MTYEERLESKRFFSEIIDPIKWQWFITLTVPSHMNYTPVQVLKAFMRWRTRICKTEKIQVIYFVIAVQFPHPHLHAVMAGFNRNGKNLFDADAEEWIDKWPFAKSAQCIERVEDVERVKEIKEPQSIQEVRCQSKIGSYFEKHYWSPDSDWRMSRRTHLKGFLKCFYNILGEYNENVNRPATSEARPDRQSTGICPSQ